ncbi:histidine kinase [Telmatobacter sp. DSM 110680]|uniref:histidine kinase n=1 Tax=Telmatobacter sp. DSM 110680 TaxID=3036704 RepID=A0AAU7DNC9_9BACT
MRPIVAASNAKPGERIGQDMWPEAERHSSAVGRFVRSWWGLALIGAVISTLAGVLFALPQLGTSHWHDELRIYLAQFWIWAALTPLIALVDRQLPFSGRELGKRLSAHILASLVFTEIYFYVFTTIRALFGVTPWSSLDLSQIFSPAVVGWQLWCWLIYWIILGGLQAYQYYNRYVNSELRLERLEHSFSEARLNALRMQLDPHFLFNALNTISSHVERDPKLTRRMIEHLGDLLRMSLESKDRQEVPLAEELAFLEHYLEIQKIRFGDQLRVVMDVAPEVKYAAVPSMFIQPLVENAIRHGISRRASGGTLTVRAKALGDRLEVRVMDDGVGLPLGWTLEGSEGLGLSITRQRIAGLHPNGASRFAIRNRPEGGTVVEVSLPLRLGESINERAYA